jgi:hypothetical protein
MKKYITLILLALFIGGCGKEVPPSAKTESKIIKNMNGWHNARWGMTDVEILKTFDGQAVRLNKAVPYGKYLAAIEINKIEIADIPLSVRFLMDTNSMKLARVQLQPINKDKGSNGDPSSLLWFTLLEIELTKKYGPPLYKDVKKDHGRTDYDVLWYFPDTSIKLICSISDVYRYTFLNYSQNTNSYDKYL